MPVFAGMSTSNRGSRMISYRGSIIEKISFKPIENTIEIIRRIVVPDCKPNADDVIKF